MSRRDKRIPKQESHASNGTSFNAVAQHMISRNGRKIRHVHSLKERLFWVIPCVVAFALYFPSLTYGFIYDDNPQIINNDQVHSWHYLPQLLTTDMWSQRGLGHHGYYYRPLFSLWLLILYSLGGASAPWWHLSSILLHVVTTYFVFRLALALTGSDIGAGCGAFVFALNPVHVEAVSWISSANEALYSALILISFLTFLQYLRGEQNGRWMALGCWTAALLAKETAAALLPIFLIVTFLERRNADDQKLAERWRYATITCIPFAIVLPLYLGLRYAVLKHVAFQGVNNGMTWTKVFFAAPTVLQFYLRHLIWPVHLTGFYSLHILRPRTASFSAELCFEAAFILFAIWATYERFATLAIALWLIILPLSLLALATRTFKTGDFVHDRYLYLPSVGISLLCALLLKNTSIRWKRLELLAFGVIAVVCSVLLFSEQQGFKSDETYFTRALAFSPDSAEVLSHLGHLYMDMGDNEKALGFFQSAHNFESDNVTLKLNLARCLDRQKRFGEARVYLQQLAELTDDESTLDFKKMALLSLAQDDIKQQQVNNGLLELRTLEHLDPRYPGLHRTLGIVLQGEQRFAEAAEEYAKEYEISGDRNAGQQALLLKRYLMQQRPDFSP